MNTANAVVIANGGVNMRESNATSSTRLATIPKDTAIKAEIFDETWSAVEYNGKSGYVMTKYINYIATENVDNSIRMIIENIEKELSQLKALMQRR